MPLTFIGYIGYIILIFFAVSGIIYIRTTYDAGLGVIFGSLLFVVASIIVPLFKINFIHTLWIVSFIWLIIMIIPYFFAFDTPFIKHFIKITGSIYASIIRIGLDKDMINSKAKELDMEFVKNWARKKELDEKIN